MKMHHLFGLCMFASLVVSSSPLAGPLVAQSGARSQVVWENDLMRVSRVSLGPNEQITRDSIGGSVIVFLTTDLDGRMPPAEAAWRDPGRVTLENRGYGRFEALVVDLKRTVTPSGATPPEVTSALDLAGPSRSYGGSYSDTVRGQNLIVNDHISVTKERYEQGGYSLDPLHFHPRDGVVIYLHSGYPWT